MWIGQQYIDKSKLYAQNWLFPLHYDVDIFPLKIMFVDIFKFFSCLHRKTTSQEDDLTGRQPDRKTTLQKDNLRVKQPQRITT